MAKIEVDVTVKAEVAKVWVDGTQVRLKNGNGRALVTPGEHHALSWAVRGAAGTSYAIRITAPSEARLSRTDTFDSEQFDAGLAWFKVLAAVCLIFVAGRVFAQPAALVARMADAAALTAHTAPGSNGALDLAPAFALEGSASGETASGQIGVLVGDLGLTVGASAPFGGSGTSTLADFDGLARKSTATAALTWQHWSVRDVTAQLDAACAAAGRAKGCSLLELKRDDSPAARAALGRALAAIDPGTLVFAGAAGKLAPERFNYLTPDDLRPERARRTSWSASATAGVLSSGGVSAAVTYTRERTYSARNAVQLCRPGPAGTALCSNEIVGGPGGASRTDRASVELRRVQGAFAISPKVTYDSLRRATGVSMPLYFLHDPAGGLRGGIVLGWRSDTNAFTASAVVGEVLGVLTR